MLRGWEGWRFGRGGALYSPCGRSFLSWELYHIRHMFSMAQHFRDTIYAYTQTAGTKLPASVLSLVEVPA